MLTGMAFEAGVHSNRIVFAAGKPDVMLVFSPELCYDEKKHLPTRGTSYGITGNLQKNAQRQALSV